MPENDAGAGSATDSAGTDGQQQGQGAPGAQDDGAQGSAGGAGAAAGGTGAGGQDAEGMLADAVSRPEGEGDGKDGADADPAVALKKAKDEFAKLQRQSRTWEQRAKDNAAKAKAHDDFVESQKTEQQKLADTAAAAQDRADKAEQKLARTLAAANYDLPVSMIDRIAGSTEDEINASAEALAAAINERAEVIAAAQAKAAGQQQAAARSGDGTRPVESLRAGGLPASGNSAGPNDWIRAAAAKKR